MEHQMAEVAASEQTIPIENRACQSCGTLVDSKFCANCGEKQLDRHDFAMKHYLEESFEGITHFDNKFFRTAKQLITRPGLLTLHFSEGKRMKYVKPFQLFVICNIVFYFIAGSLNLFSTSFSSFINHTPYIKFHTRELIGQYAKSETQFRELALQFNEKMGAESKEFIFMFIPVMAVGCTMLFFNKRKYLSEHLVFATHLFSFILIYFAAYDLLVRRPYYYFAHVDFSPSFDSITAVVYLAVIAVYFAIASRTFYKAKWWLCGIGSLFTVVIFAVSVFGYRMLLFYKIFYEIVGKSHTA